jgi:hypothetical protein
MKKKKLKKFKKVFQKKMRIETGCIIVVIVQNLESEFNIEKKPSKDKSYFFVLAVLKPYKKRMT